MAMGPIPIRMEVAFIQSSTRGPLPRRWALEGDGLHAIDGAIRHINPGAVPKARFLECLYRVNGRNFFIIWRKKEKATHGIDSVGELTEHLQNIYFGW